MPRADHSIAARGQLGRSRRIVLVTAGLMAAGAVVGAVCGAAALAIFVVSLEGPAALRDADMYAVGASFGGVTGLVLGPLFAWLLLRTVPLGRAIAVTAFSTVAGAAAGEAFTALTGTDLLGALIGGLLGFVAAALLLRAAAARSAGATPADAALR